MAVCQPSYIGYVRFGISSIQKKTHQSTVIILMYLTDLAHRYRAQGYMWSFWFSSVVENGIHFKNSLPNPIGNFNEWKMLSLF